MNAALAERREEAKLDMMMSLARSQRALSVILENVAGATVENPPVSADILMLLETLVRYQGALAQKLSVLSPSVTMVSEPGLPWINGEEGVAGPFALSIAEGPVQKGTSG